MADDTQRGWRLTRRQRLAFAEGVASWPEIMAMAPERPRRERCCYCRAEVCHGARCEHCGATAGDRSAAHG